MVIFYADTVRSNKQFNYLNVFFYARILEGRQMKDSKTRWMVNWNREELYLVFLYTKL